MVQCLKRIYHMIPAKIVCATYSDIHGQIQIKINKKNKLIVVSKPLQNNSDDIAFKEEMYPTNLPLSLR